MSDGLREWIARLAELKYEEGALMVFIEGALRTHEDMMAALETVGPPPPAPPRVEEPPASPAKPRPGRPKGSVNRTEKVLAALKQCGKEVSVAELHELLASEPVHALRHTLYELERTHRAAANRSNGEVRWSIADRDT